MGWGAAAAAGIGMLSKMSGDKAAASESAKGRAISAQAAALWENLEIPDAEKQKILLENPQLVELLQAEDLGDSAMDEISLDPKMREAQLRALADMQEQSETGLSVEDRSARNELQRDMAAQSQAEQKSILSGMAQRGTLDSGASLAAQLGSQQAGAQRGAEAADRLAADASSGRKQALMNASNLAGNMEGADFGRQAQQAQAKDIINRFNVSNRQNVSAQNIASRQALENQRAATANQQQMHNKALQQQQFQNQMQKTAGQTGQYNKQADTAASSAQAKAQAGSDMMGSMIGAGATMYAASDKRVKENIQPASHELQNLLDKLTASKYNYKAGKGLPDGEQVGVMAQDLEKSPLGAQFVEEAEDGTKMVNYGAMGSTQLAALADMHERVKQLEKDKGGE